MALPTVWNESTTNPNLIIFPEDATAGSFVTGDIVRLSATGKVELAVAGATAIGIAHADASGTEDTDIPVELFNSNDIYVGTFRAAAITQAVVGDTVDYTASAGAFTWSESGATTDMYIVGLYDAVDTTSGRIRLRVLPGGNLMIGKDQ